MVPKVYFVPRKGIIADETNGADDMEYTITPLSFDCCKPPMEIKDRCKLRDERAADLPGHSYPEGAHGKAAYAEGTAKKSVRKRAAESAEVSIKAEFDDGTLAEYIIVSDGGDSNGAERIFYLSETGRELLSAAYARQRGKRGSLGGKGYRVVSVRYPLWKDSRIGELLLRNELRIRPKGGHVYKYSKHHSNDDVIEALLYSLGTNRYEVIRATRDGSGLTSFVDVRLYREFVHKYGRPSLTPTFDDNRVTACKSSIVTRLNAKSVLKAYGYNVNKTSPLEDEARQELLAEIVDLGILPAEIVVGFLDFLIASHFTNKDTEARLKWYRDKQFIQSYRSDPQRFMRAEV